jgi:hypothetical protein
MGADMNNPPAFPSSNEVTLNDWVSSGHSGMTLRDYFAAKAMQSLLSDPDWRMDMDFSDTARAAHKMADAMLEARDGKD